MQNGTLGYTFSYSAPFVSYVAQFNPLVAIIETVSPEGTFCDTVQIPSSVGDMELI